MEDASIRRRRLVQAILAGGGLGAAGLSGFMSRALAAGDLPNQTGIARLDGSATVNGKPAKVGSPVAMGDRIATGTGSQAVVAIKGDAFLMRSQTVIVVQGREGTLSDLLIASGRVLSVFAKKPVTVKASTATIGIRGTGAYLEIEDNGDVYFCLCYGEAVIDGPKMESKVVKTTHHESPLVLRAGGVMRADPGPFKNHSDEELILLETLVGREPPFVKDGQYPAKRY